MCAMCACMPAGVCMCMRASYTCEQAIVHACVRMCVHASVHISMSAMMVQTKNYEASLSMPFYMLLYMHAHVMLTTLGCANTALGQHYFVPTLLYANTTGYQY